MANFYGVNADKILVDNPPAASGIGEVNGRVRMLYDKFTFTAVLTTSDVLYMGAKLPKGARVLDVILKSSDLGTTGTLNIGWQASAELSAGSPVEAASATGFFSALDVNAAAIKTTMVASASGTSSGVFKKFSAEVQPVIVPAANTTATSGDIEIAILYVID